MENDRKNHLTGNKKPTEIGRNINSKKGTCDKNSQSFETVSSSQNLSVRAVGRDKTERLTDGEQRFGPP